MKTETIELPFNEPDFLEAWEEWLEYRKARKLPKYVPTGMKKTLTHLKNLAENSKDKAIEIINYSMAQNYQGFFLPKNVEKPKPAVQNHQPKTVPQPEKREDVSEKSMMDWIETLKNEKRVDFMPLMVYDWLEKRGDIRYTATQKRQALVIAAKHRRQQLIDGAAPDLDEFLEMFNNGVYTGRHLEYLIALAKKVLLMDYIKSYDGVHTLT